jgi:hypothetical protein
MLAGHVRFSRAQKGAPGSAKRVILHLCQLLTRKVLLIQLVRRSRSRCGAAIACWRRSMGLFLGRFKRAALWMIFEG